MILQTQHFKFPKNLKLPKLLRLTGISKFIALILISTMTLTILSSCSSNNFYAPKLSETEGPTYSSSYPKIATIDTNTADYTDDKVVELSKYSVLIVPATILKDAENVIMKVKQENPKIKILMYQSSLYDISRNVKNNTGDQKIEESWYFHTAKTSADQTLEQRRVLINKAPVINLGGELTNLYISNMQESYKGLKNVDGIYFDNFRTIFNTNTEFQADTNNDGKDENYLTIVGEYTKSLSKILSEAKSLSGENGSIIVSTNSWYDHEPIVKGYTGNTDRNAGHNIVSGGGNALGKYDEFIGFVDNAAKENTTHFIQEDITLPKIGESEKLTLDKLSSDEQRIVRVSLCTSMMGESYFMTGIKNSLIWFSEYDTNIGKPKGEYTRLENYVHVREFENGYIIVNPNPGPIEYNFTEDNTDITSGVRGKTFTIAGKDGRIFKTN